MILPEGSPFFRLNSSSTDLKAYHPCGFQTANGSLSVTSTAHEIPATTNNLLLTRKEVRQWLTRTKKGGQTERLSRSTLPLGDTSYVREEKLEATARRLVAMRSMKRHRVHPSSSRTRSTARRCGTGGYVPKPRPTTLARHFRFWDMETLFSQSAVEITSPMIRSWSSKVREWNTDNSWCEY